MEESSVQLSGDIDELRDHLKLLVGKLTNDDGHTDDESEGYNGYGRKKLYDIIEENWGLKMGDVLQKPAKGIDLRPRKAPTKEKDISEYSKRKCKERGESLKDYLIRLNDEPKNPLDFGFPILSHLALISEYTPGMGDGMLELLNNTVGERKMRYGARKTSYILPDDIKRVIADLIEAAED